MRKNGKLNCDVCGKPGVRAGHITRTYGKGKKTLLIENVPILSCPHCRQSYFTAATMHEIERIKIHRKSLAKPKRVDVAAFVSPG